jgi:hypothetical protein
MSEMSDRLAETQRKLEQAERRIEYLKDAQRREIRARDKAMRERDEARKAIGGILAWARGDKNADYAEAEKRAEAAL